ncbi:MAG TPA: hypothetical protein VKC90_01645 [Chitinophagaceae bacterium]|nr:hypothetical protein [Chitinophagaceae bacterium]
MRTFVLLFMFVLCTNIVARSQGCVAIRNVGGVSPDLLFENIKLGDKLIFNITNRYFEASKSYKGDKLFSDTLVINRIYTMNISVIKLMKNGWSIGLNIPISANSRTNGADHNGPTSFPKYTTRAFGLGDIRIAVYKWLLNPATSRKGNIQAATGLKLATGNFEYKDYFHRRTSTGADSTVIAPVDQAIQLGDGGIGITTELSAFYSFNRRINIYFHGFYLINPREQNGVSNLKGRASTPSQIANNTTVMSVPDQYSLRGGVNFKFQKIVLTAGLRYERVPEDDLIGGNKGFRRAASITSVEPGVIYKMKNTLAFVNVGVPFKRNIILNKQNDMTPAGFANWVVSFGAQFKL